MTAPASPRSAGFIVLYRWQVEEAHQAAFRAGWRDITEEARALGSLGSCLTRDRNGDFLALALWPSEQARSDAFARMAPRAPWTGATRIEEVILDVEDDLWVGSAFAGLNSK